MFTLCLLTTVHLSACVLIFDVEVEVEVELDVEGDVECGSLAIISFSVVGY